MERKSILKKKKKDEMEENRIKERRKRKNTLFFKGVSFRFQEISCGNV